MNYIQWEKTKHDNGKYLGFFDEKEEAEEWLREQYNRYVFTPNPGNMSVRRLCREANEKGISLHVPTMTRWMKKEGIKLRDRRPRETTHEQKCFTISKIALKELDGYPNMSYIADLGIRLVLGIPTEDVVVLLPDEEQGMVTMIFRTRKKGRVEMWTSGAIDQKFEQQIRMLMQRVNKVGMEAVINYAETNGYSYYGGTKV